MPEYLAPGVYVEESDTGSKPIEGVSTSTAGVVGVAEIVTQEVKDAPALVGVTDRRVARRLHPQIHVGIDLIGPAQLDDDIARRPGWFGGFDRRIEVGQQQDDYGDEAEKREHDDVAENCAVIGVVRLVEILHWPLQGRQGWWPA